MGWGFNTPKSGKFFFEAFYHSHLATIKAERVLIEFVRILAFPDTNTEFPHFTQCCCSGAFMSPSQSSLRHPPNPHFVTTVKLASSRNENWEGDMFGRLAQQPWHFENFSLLICFCETCTRSIYPHMSSLMCNFFPGSAIVFQFPTLWGIGNPTDFQVSWGTWLGPRVHSSCVKNDPIPAAAHSSCWRPWQPPGAELWR